MTIDLAKIESHRDVALKLLFILGVAWLILIFVFGWNVGTASLFAVPMFFLGMALAYDGIFLEAKRSEKD